MSHLCMHVVVTGRVQGVFFRAHTAQKAKALGLTGWVKNVSNGSVEVLACGERAQVEALHRWLYHGPEHAFVSDVSSQEVPLQHHIDFVIEREI